MRAHCSYPSVEVYEGRLDAVSFPILAVETMIQRLSADNDSSRQFETYRKSIIPFFLSHVRHSLIASQLLLNVSVHVVARLSSVNTYVRWQDRLTHSFLQSSTCSSHLRLCTLRSSCYSRTLPSIRSNGGEIFSINIPMRSLML